MPNETGFNSFYVMSESIEEAINSLNSLTEQYSCPEHYFKYKHEYKIEEFNVNEPVWQICD